MSSLHQQLTSTSALPSPLPSALDDLLDRLNAASGYLPSNNHRQRSNKGSPPIRALLVGTSDGSPLHRSFALSPSSAASGNHGLSEEVLSSLESLYATLPSNLPPHVLAASTAADVASTLAAGLALDSFGGGSTETEAASHSAEGAGLGGTCTTTEAAAHLTEIEADNLDGLHPPHPLLSPLGCGDVVRTITTTYDSWTVVQHHLPPLVVTLLCFTGTPSDSEKKTGAVKMANLGAIQSVALPLLKGLLHPLRKSIVLSRRTALVGGGVGGMSGGAAIGPGGAAVGSGGGGSRGDLMEEAFAAGFRAGSFPRSGGGGGVSGVSGGGGGGGAMVGAPPPDLSGYYQR